jgi:hypothetical protein
MPRYAPYTAHGLDDIYNMVFADDLELFRDPSEQPEDPPFSTLFAESAPIDELIAMARDPDQESRIRALAYRRLNSVGRPLDDRVLLGTIVEKAMPGGLDTLAVYADRRVRYINQGGKLVVLEPPVPDDAEPLIAELCRASDAVIASIGPSTEDRLAPPTGDVLRLTWLVGGELYFGQGPSDVLSRDPMGGSVFAPATRVLLYMIDLGSKRNI